MAEGFLRKENPVRFFALALGISWFFWFWVILFQWNVWTFPAVIFGALGLLGPALAEIILVFLSNDAEQKRDYWSRIFDVRRIKLKWQPVIWLIFPAINLTAILLALLSGSHMPDFARAKEFLLQPWRIIPFALFILAFGPIPEELGWRGYALDSLQARFNALASSLILGLLWAVWHIPLFFMNGTYQHDKLGFLTGNFWSFMYGPFIISVLFTWIYNNNNRSTLSAILFHFMTNFTGELLPATGLSGIYGNILLTILSLTVVIVWGPETLTGKGRIRGIFPHQLSFILDFPLRRLILSPEELANRLHLREDSRVLEIGPGSGYFSVEVAKRIPKGHLELLDVQEEMLEKVRKKIESTGNERVGFTKGDAVRLPYRDCEFDIVFLVSVLGETPDALACMENIFRVLRPSGVLSVTEQPGDPDFLSMAEVSNLAKKCGFEFMESFGKGRNFTINFRKPPYV